MAMADARLPPREGKGHIPGCMNRIKWERAWNERRMNGGGVLDAADTADSMVPVWPTNRSFAVGTVAILGTVCFACPNSQPLVKSELAPKTGQHGATASVGGTSMGLKR
jgi:hypothetical protein